MIRVWNKTFVLETERTTYCFQVLETGQLEHLYYGSKLFIDGEEDVLPLAEKHAFAPGNTILYDNDHPAYSLEDMRLEMSSLGKGDVRQPFVEIVYPNGAATSDFVFDTYETAEEKLALTTLPSAYEEEYAVQELIVTLRDKNYDLKLELHYGVFEARDVITRSARLINNGEQPVTLKRLMSLQLDEIGEDFIFTTFGGNWANEIHRNDHKVCMGKIVNASVTGTSSSRANPFVMLAKENTTEDAGSCVGLNLIYSGNHYECCEYSAFGKTRLTCGINPSGFSFQVGAGELFEAPEAVLTYSDDGYNGMSRNMHTFVRECIVRGKWKKRERPVLLNSWEAAYFDINERKLLKLAKAGKEVGIELFVMDDGWFGDRNDDKTSLGDWYVNPKKLPNGVSGLCKKVNDLGLDFGIWVEPEMVNVESRLYREHPDWAMDIPGSNHAEGRNQRMLDLANPEVVDHMIKEMSDLFSSANITYVKWDMNRIVSDVYSRYLSPERQGETMHRYLLGLYRMMEMLTKRFPDILFEGCAAGGNRFDLGILCFFPQIWASDDTDAVYRVNGMTGYSYGYPMSVIGAHVSECPNHQTLRTTPLETRFAVAAFGVLGYECNLCDMKREELEEIKAQISLYKEWRKVLQFGTFYRGRNGNLHEWTCVSEDQTCAVGMIMQELMQPNHPTEQYFPKGLSASMRYELNNRPMRYDIRGFGSLVNTVSPIHIKQDSIAHQILAKCITMPGETEHYRASGSVLMSGVKLAQGFSATGYNENTRYFPDFASRMYFMKQI